MAIKFIPVFLCSSLFLIACASEIQVAQTTTEEEKAVEPQRTAEQRSIEEAVPQDDSAVSEPTYQIPPYFESTEGMILEATLNPATVPPAAPSAYVVAQNRPKLLAQLPCFCYCDRFGHRSLHDCFVTSHAVTCDVCLKEALEA